MADHPILAGEPFSPEKAQQIVESFRRDGYAYIGNVLTPAECAALRDKTDRYLDDPDLRERVNPDLVDPYVQTGLNEISGEWEPFILRNTIELDQVFRDMLVREPIFSLAEAVLGKDCKFVGQNVLRSRPGLTIERFHIDDAAPYFPLPQHVSRHDPRIRMPVMWFTVQMALTDIQHIEDGPTQYVPGSHYSGRVPSGASDGDNYTTSVDLKFKGEGPVSILCKAGDVYLQDPMCWHRGTPNTSGRIRYLFQSLYGANWAHVQFNKKNRVPVAEDALRGASDKLLNLLGRRRPNGTRTQSPA